MAKQCKAKQGNLADRSEGIRAEKVGVLLMLGRREFNGDGECEY